jgi:alkanesulfonate monooxygenase SsuD/methylene tetrahydromethanopterin reductase-like flavin-dependent oxidoreductase (luciferase family)
MAVEFGVRLPCAGVLASPSAMVSVAQAAERVGFDSVWVHDYIIWTKELDRVHISCGSAEAIEAAGPDFPPLFFESITNLAFLAGQTKRVRLGSVLALPYRSAVIAAKQLACVDVLSNGRLDILAVQGSAKNDSYDFEVLGISRAEKIGRTRETFEAMRAIWTEEAPSFDGTFVQFAPATVYPKPIQKPYPRVWIGGMRPKSMAMVADYADGWVTWNLSPEEFPAAINSMNELLVARGRETSSLIVGNELEALVAPSTVEAREQAAKTLSVLMGHYGEIGIHAEGGSGPGTQSAAQLNNHWERNLIGSPLELVGRIKAFIEGGCDSFELKFIYHDVDHLIRQLEVFGQEILPAVRL